MYLEEAAGSGDIADDRNDDDWQHDEHSEREAEYFRVQRPIIVVVLRRLVAHPRVQPHVLQTRTILQTVTSPAAKHFKHAMHDWRELL